MVITKVAKTISFLALGFAIVLASCTKPSLIGADIFPADDFTDLDFTDTISLKTTTTLGDSVRVYSSVGNEQLTNYLCGVLDDPNFGKVTSEIYNEFVLTNQQPTFDNLWSIDSLVFRVVLDADSSGYVGDRSQVQTFSIYELSEPLNHLETYYSNASFSSANLLGSTSGTYSNLTDSSYEIRGGDTTAIIPRNISFHLDPLKAMDMVNQSSNWIGSSNDFQNYFMGIHIVPDPSNTAMLRFNYSSEFSNMTLYYTEGNDPNPDSLTAKDFTFAINTQTAKIVNFNHDYTGTPVESAVNGTTAMPDSLIYVQGMEGTNAKISFPYAQDIGDIVVNNAELVLTVAENMPDTVTNPLPPYLIATQKLDGTGFVALIDVSFGGVILDSYNGTYSVEQENGMIYRRYRMNISKHFQGIVDGTVEDPDIYLTAFNRAERANSVVLGGGKNADFGAKLNLTYTKLN